MNDTFADVESRIKCTDSGSDVNLMSPDTLVSLIEKHVDIAVKPFKVKRKFGLAEAKSEQEELMYVICDREAKLTTELQILNGMSLPLRKLSAVCLNT